MNDELRAAADQTWDDDETPTVLYVCVRNAGRSQMAAAYTRALSEGRVRVLSAGMSPADEVHPMVVQALAEDGLDVSDQRPTLLTEELAEQAHVIITLGCDDRSPALQGRRTLEWQLDDPADRSIETTRRIRDQIKGHVNWLLGELEDTAAPDDDRPTLEFAVDALRRRLDADPDAASA